MKKNKPVWNTNKYIQLGKSFDVIQKRVIHFVVKQLQEEIFNLNAQTKNIKLTGRPMERTLFGDVYFHIPTKAIDPLNQDTNIRRALKGLQIPIDDDDFIGNFMLSAKREQGEWRLLFPEKSVHFLTEVSKGVTPLQTVVYLSAQSIYTIRFYELLMRFRDTGKWYTTPEEICDILEAKPTYRKDYNRLNKTIIEVAKKELKKLYDTKQSEICFDYEEIRGGRGNKIQRLIFTIFWSEKSKDKKDEQASHVQFIANNLKQIMIDNVKETKYKKANEEFINFALSKLIESKNVKNFADKLENRVLQNPKVEFSKKGAIARYILEEDFNISLIK